MTTVPERLAALEERVRHITTQADKVSKRVDEIYELLQRGKGAKYVIIGLVAFISWAVGMWASHKGLSF